MTTIYHNPRCSKSRASLQLLENNATDFKLVAYLDTPPSEAELTEILSLLGISAKQLVRTGESLYRELGLGEQDLNEAEWITILVKNPQLIERPIVVHNGKAAIGRPIENVIELLAS